MFEAKASCRTFLKGAVATLPVAAAGQKSHSSAKPNIVYLHSHDSGRYLRQ